ncbi:MAG: helicase-related protein, partial [Actinomycetes bacterium]
YHVERQVMASHNRAAQVESSAAGRRSLGAPFRWRPEGALTEMLMILPSQRLGEITDPLDLGLGRGGETPATSVLAAAELKVREELSSLGIPKASGRIDRVWYVVAMLRMQERAMPGSVAELLKPDALGDDEELGAWKRISTRLLAYLTEDPEGAAPNDLAKVLAAVGIGAPGICAFRALTRVLGDSSGSEIALASLQVGNAMRLMFDLPESVAVVKSFSRRSAHWRDTLHYCVNGNLQSVLDEYVHVLKDWVGSNRDDGKLGAVRDTAVEAIGIKAASLGTREISSDGRISANAMSLRTRFALRLDAGTTDDLAGVQRVDTVRKAFNSPFWPFVLATTSVGQEGLDFHLYCHALVHWNLPHNPVDLEQREGRVHRFKNHAVRRNLASELGTKTVGGDGDPWAELFAAAGESDGGLSPYWVYKGENKIERHVPCEPLSVDQQKLGNLLKLLGIYRLAFGQPRQEELLAALQLNPELEEQLEDLLIKLTPGRV